MKSEMSPPGADGVQILCRKSWVSFSAGVGPALVMVLLATGLQLHLANAIRAFFSAAVPLSICALAWVMHVRSVVLFMDDDGVWVQSGVLPWRRGLYGVKWRDIEVAYYSRGFLPWITRSYPVRVVNRFSRHTEIALTNIARGDKAVLWINETLAIKARKRHL